MIDSIAPYASDSLDTKANAYYARDCNAQHLKAPNLGPLCDADVFVEQDYVALEWFCPQILNEAYAKYS